MGGVIYIEKSNFINHLLIIIFQCFIHKNLGWKIIVKNKGEKISGVNATSNTRTNLLIVYLFTFTSIILERILKINSLKFI